MKKSQSAMEFMIIVGVLLLIVLGISYTFYQNISEKEKQQKNLVFHELAKTVQKEIELASKTFDGYQREFEIPDKVAEKEYNITIVESVVFVQTTDGKIALALPVKNVTGQIQKGQNIIRKINGSVFLNE